MIKTKSRIISYITVIVIYFLAFVLVHFVFPFLPFNNSMLKVFAADFLATVLVFIFSIIFSNSSVYDPYWSVAPPVIVIYLIKLFPEGNEIRQAVILGLVLFWSIRLTVNWARGWQGFQHQDWRYISIAEKTGKLYWPVSFTGIHLMPTIFVFLGCLPLWYSLSSTASFNWVDVIAALVTFTAILVEWISDEQLKTFKKAVSKNSFIETGLWAFSRHPNYLGEISFWFGLFLFVVSTSGLIITNGYWTAIGFVSMIILFKFISIPLMEKRNISKKAGYTEYIKKVPALVPNILKNYKSTDKN